MCLCDFWNKTIHLQKSQNAEHTNAKVLLLYRKALSCITNSRSTPTLRAKCSSHLWYLYPLRKASFSCLCESCLSCPFQQAAVSNDQRLQPLYSSLTEDTAPFSPIEPLRAPGEPISTIDELHSTNHRRHTDPHRECMRWSRIYSVTV